MKCKQVWRGPGSYGGVDHWEIEPDILATAKSLGGGVMPVSAVTTTEEIFKPMMYPNPFMHTTTTGGGALSLRGRDRFDQCYAS